MTDTVADRDYRRRWVVLSDQALLDALPVPKDAHLVAIRQAVESATVEMLLESDEYPVVPEGSVVLRVACGAEEDVGAPAVLGVDALGRVTVETTEEGPE